MPQVEPLLLRSLAITVHDDPVAASWTVRRRRGTSQRVALTQSFCIVVGMKHGTTIPAERASTGAIPWESRVIEQADLEGGAARGGGRGDDAVVDAWGQPLDE